MAALFGVVATEMGSSHQGWDGQAGVSPSPGQDCAAVPMAKGREASGYGGKEVLRQSLWTKSGGGDVFPIMRWSSLWHPSTCAPHYGLDTVVL